MANWWGNMSGAQAVEMGMNIFNLAQQQALQKKQEEQIMAQQKQENFFRQMQLNMQKEQLGLQKEKQEANMDLAEREMRLKEGENKRYEATQQKLVEYSTGLADMLETLDFSKSEDMKKLYAFQAKYQPYGVTPKYIKPEKPEQAIEAKDYGNLVFRVWDKLRDYMATEYKQEMKNYEEPGFLLKQLGKRTKLELPAKPELELPTMEQAKELADLMLSRGQMPEDLNFDDLLGKGKKNNIPPTPPPSPQAPPLQTPQAQTPAGLTAPPAPSANTRIPKSPYSGILSFFSPTKRKYNSLSPQEKRAVDRYVKYHNMDLDEALDWLDKAKEMKRQ